MPVMAYSPFNLLSCDVYGPIPVSANSVVALFVAQDVFSGYVSIRGMKSMRSASFVYALNKILEEYEHLGFKVDSLLSDNASQFRSNDFNNFLESKNISHRYITPYNANANPVERQMRVIFEKLRLILNDPRHPHCDHTRWFAKIKEVQDAINVAANRSRFSVFQ